MIINGRLLELSTVTRKYLSSNSRSFPKCTHARIVLSLPLPVSFQTSFVCVCVYMDTHPSHTYVFIDNPSVLISFRMSATKQEKISDQQDFVFFTHLKYALKCLSQKNCVNDDYIETSVRRKITGCEFLRPSPAVGSLGWGQYLVFFPSDRF